MGKVKVTVALSVASASSARTVTVTPAVVVGVSTVRSTWICRSMGKDFVMSAATAVVSTGASRVVTGASINALGALSSGGVSC